MALSAPPSTHQELSAARMLRWALFLLLVISVWFFYLLVDFKGLSHAKGMDQAQIAREIARGGNFITKCIRPVALYQIEKHMEEKALADGNPPPTGRELVGVRDTYHAPLNPLLNSIVLRLARQPATEKDDGFGWSEKDRHVYHLDYWIAATSMLLLLAGIGVTYLLVSRIFDTKIGGITALMMLLCQLLWRFAETGLPQPLMLFLFSFALYFYYKAVEATQLGRGVYLWSILSAMFFGLLALAHWISIWIFIGALLYAAFFFRPRGLVAIAMLGVFLMITLWWALLVNLPETGNPMGSGLYQFYAGLAGGSEAVVMRNYNPDLEPFNPTDGFLRKVTIGIVTQLGNIMTHFGGVMAAALFFLSLLHPFKRPEIAKFRWAILIMWVTGAIGMAVFGLPENEKDPNQLHILFIGPMAAYGLALLAVLWSRLSLPNEYFMVRHGHFIIALLTSASPMLLTLPWDLYNGMQRDFKANWPPYIPEIYPALTKQIQPNEITATDSPWAMAWYGDRTAVWLPRTRQQFYDLYDKSRVKGYPITSILFTPISTHEPYAAAIANKRGEWGEWGPLIEHYTMWESRPGSTLPNIEDRFPLRYPWRVTGSADMFIYKDRPETR